MAIPFKGGLAVLALGGLALVGISHRSARATNEAAVGRDLLATGADTEGVRGSETYVDYDARRDSLGDSPGDVEGYGCTIDCSGHEAGYRWAEQHDVTDEGDCHGKSWSFEEGCVAYVEGRTDDDVDDDQ
jgi:hypothetical protein